MKLTEVAMFTEDVPATTAFYEELFGAPAFANESIASFDVNGVEILVHETDGGNDDDTGAEGPPNEDHLAFAVEDVDGAFAALAEGGLEVLREPADYEWGRSAYFVDPDRRLVEITEG